MKTRCPACHSLYPITEDHLGRSAKCKKCGSRFVVQAFDPLDAVLDDVTREWEPEETIGREAPPAVVEAPPQRAPAVKKKRGPGGGPWLTALFLIAALTLAGMLWMKMNEVTALQQERDGLKDQVNKLQALEKTRKKTPKDLGLTFDFRHTRWGMTKNNVIASQGRLPDQDLADAVQYTGALLGQDALITYGFRAGRLIRARYDITGKFADPAEYLVTYNGLKVILAKKYGPPSEEKAQWKDQTHAEDQSQWGRALAEGLVTFFSQWETRRTTIRMVLSRTDGDITCVIEYTGKIMSPPGGDVSDSSPLDIL